MPAQVKYLFAELLDELVHKAAQKCADGGTRESKPALPGKPRSALLKMVSGRSGDQPMLRSAVA
ncbi:MAG TPA: hypothetical protein VN639_14420 [Azonexus sp.]|nr:hypothetical protein [Azonexus sp.]